MDKILQENDIIQSMHSQHKTSLCGGDNIRNENFHAFHSNLGNKLVEGIAKANRSKIGNHLRVRNFGNENEISNIPKGIHIGGLENGLDITNSFSTNDIPMPLVESRIEAIGARGFEGGHIFKGKQNLLGGRNNRESGKVIMISSLGL